MTQFKVVCASIYLNLFSILTLDDLSGRRWLAKESREPNGQKREAVGLKCAQAFVTGWANVNVTIGKITVGRHGSTITHVGFVGIVILFFAMDQKLRYFRSFTHYYQNR